MDDPQREPQAKPSGDKGPPGPPRRTAIGLGPDDGDPSGKRRATITKAAIGEGKFIRQSGGRGQYGHVLLRIEPNTRNAGIRIVSDVSADVLPNEFVQSAMAGVRSALLYGMGVGDLAIHDHYLVDVIVHVIDGSFHKIDSSDIAFKMAGIFAFRDALKTAQPIEIQ